MGLLVFCIDRFHLPRDQDELMLHFSVLDHVTARHRISAIPQPGDNIRRSKINQSDSFNEGLRKVYGYGKLQLFKLKEDCLTWDAP